MRNLLLQLLIAITVIFNITSCSTKINIIAPYKSITVVYGIMDCGDTAHYVRIQKAFLSQTQSAQDLTKIPDSSFFLDLDVSVKEINPANGTILRTILLNKVNMRDEGYSKDTGIFFTDPSYAYKFKYPLSPNYWYRLIIHNPKTGDIDSAQTCILTEDTNVNHFFVPFFDRPYPIILGQTAYINPDVDFTIENCNAPDSTKMINAIFRAHWIDKDTTTGVETDRSYDWPFKSILFDAPTTLSTSGFYLYMPAGDFVTAYKKGMGPAPLHVVRYLDSSDIIIYASTNITYDFQQSYQFQQSGLVITNAAPHPFTNIAGKDVYGFFTCVAHRGRYNIYFQKLSFDYIVSNPDLDSMHIASVPADH